MTNIIEKKTIKWLHLISSLYESINLIVKIVVVMSEYDLIEFFWYVFNSFAYDVLIQLISNVFSFHANWFSIFNLILMTFIDVFTISISNMLDDVDIWWSWKSIDEFDDIVEWKILKIVFKFMCKSIVFNNESLNVKIFDSKNVFDSKKQFLFQNFFSMFESINIIVVFIIFLLDMITSINFSFDLFIAFRFLICYFVSFQNFQNKKNDVMNFFFDFIFLDQQSFHFFLFFFFFFKIEMRKIFLIIIERNSIEFHVEIFNSFHYDVFVKCFVDQNSKTKHISNFIITYKEFVCKYCTILSIKFFSFQNKLKTFLFDFFVKKRFSFIFSFANIMFIHHLIKTKNRTIEFQIIYVLFRKSFFDFSIAQHVFNEIFFWNSMNFFLRSRFLNIS